MGAARFAAVEVRLVVAVGGEAHRGRERQDARTGSALEGAGWRVVRVTVGEVMEDVGGVIGRVVRAVRG